ncbi:hypothetical protein PR048_031124 [Dryococelus australis]|uniref:Uncharacterized protein n=1 Tax=Dryococelus australis TaxID=614101 RepID=A0ABQ9G4D3_9NEOP|nr:hypothetical protein PR048_031124 [Dryococelus australis]
MGDYGVADHITQLCISLCRPFFKFSFDSSLDSNKSGHISICLVRRVKFDGVSIEILCFCLMNSRLLQKCSIIILLCTRKLNGHKTILESQFREDIENKFSGRTMLQTILNNFGGSKFP